jgi:bifunctional non-homologous end joining protein LigD
MNGATPLGVKPHDLNGSQLHNAGVLPEVHPQLVSNDGRRVLQAAICDPQRYAVEPKVDGVRGLLEYLDDGRLEMRNRRGEWRDWLRSDEFAAGIRRLGARLPLVWRGTILDGELTTGRFATTMSALQGSSRHRPSLRFVVFDVPVLAGVDLRRLPWRERRDRLELLAQAFEVPVVLSRLVEPSVGLVEQMTGGALEGIVLKDREAPYRNGSRIGWAKVKDRS